MMPYAPSAGHRDEGSRDRRTVLMLHGEPITRGGDALSIGRVAGTKGQPHRTLKGGHFIQEDDPAGFSQVLIDLAGRAV